MNSAEDNAASSAAGSAAGSAAANAAANATTTIETRLTQLWGMEKPIIGAPMAGRAGGELAAAVSRAGGLGMFGVGAGTSAEWIRENAAVAAEAGVYGIGVIVWALEERPEQWEAVLEAKPTVVSLGFGDPAAYVASAHEAGISVVAPVNDISQLRQALAAEVDAICVQGADAGGHTGRHIGTMPLMQLVLDYIELNAPGIPVAVAGGIGTGRGVAACLAAGADAVWVGTALLGSPESVGSDALREAAVAAGSHQTVLTDVYDRAEQVAWDTEKWPTRTVRNAFVDVFAPLSAAGEVTDEELVAARSTGGDFADELKLHAGQGIGLLRGQVAAEEVVRKLHEDAVHYLYQRR